jgi:hypothetical protein
MSQTLRPSRDTDQVLCEVGIDVPVAHGVGICQRVAGNRAAKTQMVAWTIAREDKLRCRAGFHARSIARRRDIDTDQGTKTA